MSGSIDLKTFLEERFLIYDPDTDLNAGSPAQLTVIDPTVRRFQPDPFEMDLPTFIKARLRQEYPNLQAEDGDALADFLVKPMEALLDPFVREVQFLRNNQSLVNPELLAPAEADSLMGNIFVRRSRGKKSVGNARMYFNAATALTVSVGNNFYTADGLNFIPSGPQSISAEAMLFNQSGNLFYFDVALEAETEGDEYNIDPEKIVGVTNIPSAVRATNLRPFKDGIPEESTIGYIERGETSLTERSMVIPRGVLARLFDVFGDLQHLQVVGFNDPEMMRDIIEGGGLGIVRYFGMTGFTQDDGNGDSYSSVWEDNVADFIAVIGPIGVVTNFILTTGGADLIISEVINAHAIKILNIDGGVSTLPDFLSNREYYIRRKELTLSTIPGGIVYPLGPNGEIVIAGNEVHIGGCSDFYVRGITPENAEQVIKEISDEYPLMEGKDLEVQITGLPLDVVRASSVDFVSSGVKAGHSLVIEGAGIPVAGSYQILKVAPGGVGHESQLLIDPAPGAHFANLTYKIVDELFISLNEPKNMRETGTDLKTVMGSKQVSTVSEVDFASVGGQIGDTLRVLPGSISAGDYGVQQVTGTGNKLLVVDRALRRTSDTEPWQLFNKQAGIKFPLIRIKTIDLLDSSLNPTGETLPYADPVDIQSSAFSNAGIGRKKEVTDARVGIIGPTDFQLGASALNGLQLQISVNNTVPLPINFSGVTILQQAVNQINAVIPRVAEVHQVGSAQYLAIRSSMRWLQVSPAGTANVVIGFSTTEFEDSRQVISPNVADWTQFGIEEGDSVYILTGDDIGFWWLQSVSPGRLLIAQVDDSASGRNGKVVFPLPSINTTVRVGSRSFGKVRCYFLEPTSFEVRGGYRKAALRTSSWIANRALVTLPGDPSQDILADEELRTEFALDIYGDGKSFRRFIPDPELELQVLPATAELVPNNLVVTNGSSIVESIQDPLVLPSGPGQYSRAAKIDFLLREILPGDLLEITYQPIQGTADIRQSPTGSIDYTIDPNDVEGKTLTFSLENGPDKTVTFDDQVDGPAKLVAEINAQLGTVIAYVEDTGSGQYLRFETDFPLIIRSSTDPNNANVLFGLSPGNNDAKAKGIHTVLEAGWISGAVSNHYRIIMATTFVPAQAGIAQHFIIRRPGVQRVSSTDMAKNKEGALYYADIELVSDGVGDEFNISQDLQLTAEQYKADGYHLYVEDENLSFSTAEVLDMYVGRRMLPVGATDSPANMRQLSLSNIQLNYERSPLVEEIQNFAQSELDRVLTASILVRHLQPHFVQAVVNYTGGSLSDVVISDIEDLINGLLPDEALEASAIGEIPRRRGASSVEMPIVVIGVVHYKDRKVRAVRSKNFITAGRLATFIPDILDVTRGGS